MPCVDDNKEVIKALSCLLESSTCLLEASTCLSIPAKCYGACEQYILLVYVHKHLETTFPPKQSYFDSKCVS